MVSYAEISRWGDKLSVTASFRGAASTPGETVELIVAGAEAWLAKNAGGGGNRLTVLAQ
jgi:hypothetical protein